jgi:hypothetical protein
MLRKAKKLYLSSYLEIASSSLANEGIEISSCKDIQMKHKNLNGDADSLNGKMDYECMYLNFIQPFLLLSMVRTLFHMGLIKNITIAVPYYPPPPSC